MAFAAVEDYARIVATRIRAERVSLAGRWLYRLKELLTVEPNDVFPSQQLLDHIPALIEDIASYLAAPEHEEIAANATVIEKARELGLLRHQQQASVHQLLREYEILSEILEGFVVDETGRLGLGPAWAECFEVHQRLTRAARTLMRTTVDTFVSEYTTTLQERNARIQEFSRLAGHELRSPIRTLHFAADALDSESHNAESSPERLRLLATTVRTSTGRLSWLIENQQRLARVNEPFDLPSEQDVAIATIATEVARQLQEMAATRGVTIRIDPKLPFVHADAARVELVLLNLVANAIKFSDPNKSDPVVEIASVAEDVVSDTCAFLVRDNGVGISDQVQTTIVSRFVQGDSDVDRVGGTSGAGLGLAIAAECVKALGGTIHCTSVEGEGTTFLISIPRGSPTAMQG